MHQAKLNVIRNNRAVTMIELMIAVGIIGVLAGVAAPSFRNFLDTIKVKGSSQDIYSALYSARSMAITKGLEHRVLFGTNTFTVQRGNQFSGSTAWSGASSTATLPGGGSYASFDTNFPTDSGNKVCVFRPNGTAVISADSVFVDVANVETKRYRITIAARTGFVQVRKQ